MTAEEFRSIVKVAVREALDEREGRMPTDAILSRAEAKAYVKKNSEAAFHKWCEQWGAKPRQRGRYSRCKLDLALEREAGLRRTLTGMGRRKS